MICCRNITHHATSRMTARKRRAETALAPLAIAIVIKEEDEVLENIFHNFFFFLSVAVRR